MAKKKYDDELISFFGKTKEYINLNFKTYKLRAECIGDVLTFIEKTSTNTQRVLVERYYFFPDVECEFETDLKLEEILLVLKTIPDSQIMIDTLKTLSEYTGERFC